MIVKSLKVTLIGIFVFALLTLISNLLFGGIPAGFKNNRILVFKSYCATDAGCPLAITKVYPKIKNSEECKKIGGTPFLGGIGIYEGCRP